MVLLPLAVRVIMAFLPSFRGDLQNTQSSAILLALHTSGRCNEDNVKLIDILTQHVWSVLLKKFWHHRLTSSVQNAFKWLYYNHLSQSQSLGNYIYTYNYIYMYKYKHSIYRECFARLLTTWFKKVKALYPFIFVIREESFMMRK